MKQDVEDVVFISVLLEIWVTGQFGLPHIAYALVFMWEYLRIANSEKEILHLK